MISVLIYSINCVYFFLCISPRPFSSISTFSISSTSGLSSCNSISHSFSGCSSLSTTITLSMFMSMSISLSLFLCKYVFKPREILLGRSILSKRIGGRLCLLGALLGALLSIEISGSLWTFLLLNLEGILK